MSKLFHALRKILLDEGGVFFIYILMGKIISRLRSKFYAFILSAKNLNIEGAVEVRGIKHIKIGENFYSKSGLWLEAISDYMGRKYVPFIDIGSRVSFSKNVHISCAHKVFIGDDVLIGSNVLITDNSHGVYSSNEWNEMSISPRQRHLGGLAAVHISANVWICDDVKILNGVKIGFGSVIGAGSVVKGDIPDFCIASGNPARPYKFYNINDKEWVFINERK